MTETIKIYKTGGAVLMEVIVTQSAEHEEELMKSDFIKLSWDDAEWRTIPVDAYIEYEGIRYSLLEPYVPEQRSEAEYRYEPKFHHPKMYLSKVPFTRPTKDSSQNDINLIDWAYTGFVGTLLQYFCEQMEDALGVGIIPEIVGEIDNIVTVSFQTVDILSALSVVAGQLECEWHIDWNQKRLYFGHVMLRGQEQPVLEVGKNVCPPSVRNSKDGYWNAFEPQGSTRNITRRVAGGDYVSAGVRLSLKNYDGYSDGIIYSLGEHRDGNLVTYNKSQFDTLGVKPYVKTLIFEDIFPNQDLYAYNIKYRESYLLEDEDNPNSMVISHYNGTQPVYKRYAKWYMRLAYQDDKGEWHDFDISDVRDTSVQMGIIENDKENHFVRLDFNLVVNSTWFTQQSETHSGTYIVRVKCGNAEIRGYIDGSFFPECRFNSQYKEEQTSEDDRVETDLQKFMDFQDTITAGGTIMFTDGVVRSKFPKEYSQIIDGKELYCQFKVNTEEGAESTPLAGRGNGDNGNYGFALRYMKIEGEGYVSKANREPKEGEGDTGVVYYKTGEAASVTLEDYEIEFQQTDDYILPTTVSEHIHPMGESFPSTKNNIVNLYNIVMDTGTDSHYETKAKGELKDETLKYMENQFTDNNSYTVKSDPTSFKQMHEGRKYLSIGQMVTYKNGDYELETRVMKLVTKLDFDFEQEITVGNEVLRGSQTQLKDQVRTLVSGGAGGSGGGGGGSGYTNKQTVSLVEVTGSNLFISKVNDDEAAGLIGFLKGAWFGAKQWMIDAIGNANLNNVTVNGVLRALNSYINKVRSTNYTGDGLLDTGWQIQNDYEGYNSKAVFDYLTIRKKAFFNELEIRRLSYVGGNFVFSPASGRIWRVELYSDVGITTTTLPDGTEVPVVDDTTVTKENLMGYDEITSMWMIGNKILSLFSKSAANRFLSRHKRIATQIPRGSSTKTRGTESSGKTLQDAKLARCYLFTDDGSTATMNYWTVGAQARCQTFNIEKQMKYDGQTYIGQNVANTYWWRMVSGVGKGMCDDGKEHYYVDFILNAGSSDANYSVRDGGYDADFGCDIPAVGDQMVQMGHRFTTELMNVIMIETIGGDAPAIKEYKGIRGWSLEGKQKTKISPTTGTVMYATHFHIETEYGDVLIPKDRGAWYGIPLEDNGKEPSDPENPDYSDDILSGGSFVSRSDGSAKNHVRKCYYYDRVSHLGSLWLCIMPEGTYKEYNGKQISENDIAKLSPEEQLKVETRQVFTGIEPGDATLAQQAVWQKNVDKGEQGEASFKSTMFVRMNATPQKPADNAGSYADPSPANQLAGRNSDNQNVYWSDGIPAGDNIIWATTRIFSTDGQAPQQASWSEPRPMTDTMTYDVEFAKMQPGDAKPATPTDANRHGGSGTQVWFDPVLDASEDFTAMYWRAERECENGVWSAWTVIRIKGEKGNNATTTALRYTGPLAADATAPTVNTYKSFTWQDAIPQQTEALPNVYVGVWEFEAGSILDIHAKAPKSVTLFAHYGKTGADGRAVVSVTEYYKATSSDAAMPVQTSDTGWDTNPNLPSLTNKWGPTYKYLWNYEKVEYSKGTTIERTVPQIAAIWTKDGKGIASITEYYLISASSSGVTRNTSGWGTNVVTPTKEKPYLWNYEMTTWTEGDPSYSEPHVIGHFGSDGTNGSDGKNGTSIVPVPNAIVITQQKVEGGAMPLINLNEVITIVARDGATIVASSISNVVQTHCTTSLVNNNTTTAGVKIESVTKDGDDKYYTSGSVAFDVSAQTAAGQTFTASVSVPFACNMIGTYIMEIDEDMKKEVASKVEGEITQNGVLTSTNFDNHYTNASWGVKQDITKTINELKGDGSYDRSTGFTNSRLSTAETDINLLRDDLGNTNTAVNTANESIRTISNDLSTNYSTTEQTDSKIAMSVVNASRSLLDSSISVSSAWEQGSTDGEATGKTYSDIKVSSSTRIRTKNLFPVTDTVILNIGSSYDVEVHAYDADMKLITMRINSRDVLYNWFTDDTVTLRLGEVLSTDTLYLSFALRRSSGGSIYPSVVSPSVISAGILSRTGIDIETGKITMTAGSIKFNDSYGGTVVDFNNDSHTYSLGGFYISDDTIGDTNKIGFKKYSNGGTIYGYRASTGTNDYVARLGGQILLQYYNGSSYSSAIHIRYDNKPITTLYGNEVVLTPSTLIAHSDIQIVRPSETNIYNSDRQAKILTADQNGIWYMRVAGRTYHVAVTTVNGEKVLRLVDED